MKQNKNLIFYFIFILILSSLSFAFTPKISYMALFIQNSSNNQYYAGNHTIQSDIYYSKTGGISQYTQTNTTFVSNGTYAIILANSGISGLDYNNNFYIESKIGSQIISPRLEVTPVPQSIYSMLSNRSYYLGSYLATQYQRVLQNCSSGSSIREVLQDGSVVCETDNDQDTTYTADEDYINLVGTQFNFNASKLATVYYNGNTSSAVTGSVIGTLLNTIHNDGRYDGITLNVTESSGSPGLDLRINFTGITEFNTGIMRYYTTVLSGSFPIIQLWNYDDSVWEDYNQVATSTSFSTITETVYDDNDHISGGVVQMRIYKATNGNTNNKYYIDWVAISKGFSTPSGQETDPYSIHRDGTIPLMANWNAGSYNISFNSGGGINASYIFNSPWLTSYTDTDTDTNITVVSLGISGTTTKTLNLEQQTKTGTKLTNVTVSWTDYDTDTNTFNSSADMINTINKTVTYVFSTTGNAATSTATTSDSTWTSHNSYPDACSAGQYVSQIGDTLTCGTPTDTDTDTNITVVSLGVSGTTTKTLNLEQQTKTGTKLTNVTVSWTDYDTDTNTNAATICSGTTTYLDGEGNCDDISSVYAASSHSQAASTITAGTFGTGSYVFDTNITVENIRIEGDVNNYIGGNSTCIIIKGDTSILEVC